MWRTLTRDDLISKQSEQEANAFSKKAWTIDPIPPILEMTADFVRDACRSNGNVRLSPEPHSIPGGTITKALDYAIYDLLKRIGVPIGKDREKAREKAEIYFDDIAKGKINPESYGVADTAQSGGPAVSLAATYPDRLGCMKGF
jgi:hypothetical protein